MASKTTTTWINLLMNGQTNEARRIHAEIRRRGTTDTDSLLAWYGGSERTGEVFATLKALDHLGGIARSRLGRRPKGRIRHLDSCPVP
jgi:hypothetical protein